MRNKIVTDETLLRRKCDPVRNVREGGEVARKLQDALRQVNKRALNKFRKSGGKSELVQGIGLSAPQIGIHKQVCLLMVNERPIVLMNPVIIGQSHDMIQFDEGCLSFPGVKVTTRRHLWVIVDTLNTGMMTFGPTDPLGLNKTSLLLSVAAQHEIAHLSGQLMQDFAIPAKQEAAGDSTNNTGGVRELQDAGAGLCGPDCEQSHARDERLVNCA